MIFPFIDKMLNYLSSIEFLVSMFIFTIILHLVLFWFRDRKFLHALWRNQGPKSVNINDLDSIPLINITIQAWNEGENFKRCLLSCSKLSYPKLKVIVNAGGNQETINIANEFKKNDKFVILIQKNARGKIAALNECLDHLEEGLVFMVDADVIITDEVLLRMIYPIINLGENVVVGGHRPLDSQLEKDLVKYNKINRYYYFRYKYNKYNRMSVGGANTVVSYEVIKEVKQFNTSRNWAEDRSRGEDIVQKGFKIYRLPDYRANIYSVAPDTIKKWLKQKIRWNENARMYSFEKNLKMAILKVIILTLFGVYFLLFPFLIYINLGFLVIGIFILSNIYLVKVRRLLFFNMAVQEKFKISVNVLFFIKILLYIYIEAFVHLYIAIELLLFRGKKLKKRKNL